MKPLATLVLLAVLALPASAAVIHTEAINGDLSTNEAAPTFLNFAPGGNTVIGSVTNSGGSDPRDYITFTISAGLRLIMLNLVAYAPSNISFVAFNSGTTSYIPSIATDPQFLSGIHLTGASIGTDIMPLFVTSNVTSNALAEPELGPGSYCFVIQQANTTTTSYSLEFVIDGGLPAQESTWGAIKQLYR